LTGPLADKDHLVDWDHKYVQVFCDLARKYSIDIVPGTIVEGDKTEDAVINSAYYIDNKGNILMDYQKVHLWHPERKWLTRGTSTSHVILPMHEIA
jgi:predicted amidohydrolase